MVGGKKECGREPAAGDKCIDRCAPHTKIPDSGDGKLGGYCGKGDEDAGSGDGNDQPRVQGRRTSKVGSNAGSLV